jgi:hypothetical protein
MPPPEDSCLLEAQKLVYGDRNEAYGHPLEDYSRTVRIFNAITGRDLTESEGVVFMLAVKLSRLMNKKLRDNYTDLAGYTEVLWIVDKALAKATEHAGPVP